MTQARRDELGTAALDPRSLVLYRENQYADLPYAPYRDESVLGWVPARSLVTDRSIMVPAMAVFTSYNVRMTDEFLFPVTSNGLAAGPTLCEAVLAATLEVLERDAFMITWLNRLPGRPADPQSHPDPEVAELCESYRRRGSSCGFIACRQITPAMSSRPWESRPTVGPARPSPWDWAPTLTPAGLLEGHSWRWLRSGLPSGAGCGSPTRSVDLPSS